MNTEDLIRPPVAVGHVWLKVTDIPQATQYFVMLGLRVVHQAQTIAVLELRGGTHLVLQPTQEPSAVGTKAPFDLMVDDIVTTQQKWSAMGLNPSALESGVVHRSFTLPGPDGYIVTVTSSHTGGRVV